jgi:hypothetical protein
VLLLAIGQENQAVLEARITLELRVSASLGALHEVPGIFVLSADRRPNRNHDGQGQRGRSADRASQQAK